MLKMASSQQTTLVLILTNQNGIIINTTTVNHPVFLGGSLLTRVLGLPYFIGNAYVDIQSWDGNTWTTFFTATTGTTGTANGCYGPVMVTPNTSEVFLH